MAGRAGRGDDCSGQGEVFAMTAVTLHRIDPAHNMARFYALDVQPDLFGCILLVKAWGRIGTHGRVVQEMHLTEAQARAALQRQAERKRRRGYSL